MDRNQALGLILISLLVIVYFQFFAPKTEPPTPQPVETSHTQAPAPVAAEVQALPQAEVLSDSLQQIMNQARFGIFYSSGSGNDQLHTLENEELQVQISTKGAIPGRVWLKSYKTYAQEPLVLIDQATSKFSLITRINGIQVNLAEMYYEASKSQRGDTTVLTLSTQSITGARIVHEYSLAPKGYKVDYRLKLEGFAEGQLDESVTYQWSDNIRNPEKDIQTSRVKTTVNYYTADGSFDYLSERSTSKEEVTLAQPVRWMAFKQKFFTAGFIAPQNFRSGYASTEVDPADTANIKLATMRVILPMEDLAGGKGEYAYYFGPNNYQILKKIEDGFHRNLSLGWPPISLVNKYLIIPIFNFLQNYISNYGLIIIILVLAIKLLLSPLSYKSYISMAKMKVLKPEMDAIKEKYPEDMAKSQQETMKLYNQVGVNPLSGCIPVLLQMPILFAMFYFFPESIELRQQAFLWADDLSTFDAIVTWSSHVPLLSSIYGNHISLFTLLMTASTILYTWSNNQVSTAQGPMKTITYMMPVIFMFVLNSFPAGLTFYYFVSNIVTFGQQAIIRKFVDEDKIRLILDENKKRNANKKKSKFQMRIEEAMKAGEQKKKK
jgi:YidC/Oxa1 family membrane protein insertase